MRFEWDAEKNKANIHKHGIDFADAREIFTAPMLVALDNRQDDGEDRWIGIGMLKSRTVDIPPLSESYFARAAWRKPQPPIEVTLHLDPDVLAWFKTQGTEYEQRINAALRIYAEAHKAYSG